jgi:hypothetical protein
MRKGAMMLAPQAVVCGDYFAITGRSLTGPLLPRMTGGSCVWIGFGASKGPPGGSPIHSFNIEILRSNRRFVNVAEAGGGGPNSSKMVPSSDHRLAHFHGRTALRQ